MQKVKPQPYIGITGLTSMSEIRAIFEINKNLNLSLESNHLPMLGFLVSDKTLRGSSTENYRYPSVRDIPYLVEKASKEAFSMIHYNTHDKTTIFEQVKELFDKIYPLGCRAIQFNVIWPPAEQISLIKDSFPEMKIVFQASKKVMTEHQNEIVEKLNKYVNNLDYFLIDPSSGIGKEFNLEESLNFYNLITNNFSHLTIGFAGGLNSTNVYSETNKILNLIKSSDFCIDAEGGLRNKVTEIYGQDFLDINQAKGYLSNALKAFNKL
ncbi:hypothetical protein J4403_03950 [Candidatus Woesearchaeota archaeon]|nr:hypothetical protein [Candidatus Woesearchaeota archaeon]